nr:xylulose kinase-1 [Tanacetum cinerariifolium]
NGNGPVSTITDTNGMIKVLPLKTVEEVVAREKERKARTTLQMALPEDHLAKFHKMVDAKEMWEAIKSIFEGLHKGYDRFQTLLVQLEMHGFGVLHEDANQKFLRSLPSPWSQVALIMRTKTWLDTLSFDDLYNNLRVFERHFARDCRAKGNQDIRKIDFGYNKNKARDNVRRPAYQDDSKALVTIDGEDIDWSGHVEEDVSNYAIMAYSSSNSGSDNEVKSCSKTCAESYARLKKLYDEQRDKLGDISVEITAYTLALKRLLNTQMSANDKFGLGYGDYRYGTILSYENKVLQSVFMNKESDLEDTPIDDRYAERMHAVPPPMIGNYMPSRPNVEIDYSKFTYGPKQTSVDESDAKTSEYTSCESESSVETTTSMPAPEENAPKVVCEPKVWTDAPIIKEYESDSDNDSVLNV